MAKYYVESGELRMVIQEQYPIRAAARALARSQGLRLSTKITVNERGFISARAFQQRYRSDLELETGTLLAMLAEHDIG